MLLKKLIKEAIANDSSYKDYVKKTLLRNKSDKGTVITDEFAFKAPKNITTKEDKLVYAMFTPEAIQKPNPRDLFTVKRKKKQNWVKEDITDFKTKEVQNQLTPEEAFVKNSYEKGYDKDYNSLARGFTEEMSQKIKSNPDYLNYVGALHKGSDILNKAIQKSKFTKPFQLQRHVEDFTTSSGKKFSELKPGDTFTERGFTSTHLPAIDPDNHAGPKSFMVIDVPGNNKQSFLNVGGSRSSVMPHEKEILLPQGLEYKLEEILPNYQRRFSIVNPYSIGLLATGIGVSQMKRGNRLKFKLGGSLKPSNKPSNALKSNFNSNPLKEIKVAHNRYLALQFKTIK
jgi:ADP-ribosyltransferase exoenzyme